jgi:hypothetical protein
MLEGDRSWGGVYLTHGTPTLISHGRRLRKPQSRWEWKPRVLTSGVRRIWCESSKPSRRHITLDWSGGGSRTQSATARYGASLSARRGNVADPELEREQPSILG